MRKEKTPRTANEGIRGRNQETCEEAESVRHGKDITAKRRRRRAGPDK